jgi:hypothetical protein
VSILLRLGAVILALLVVGSRVTSAPADQGSGDVTVVVDRSVQDGVSSFAVGVSHMQYSLDSWGDPTAIANAKSLLRESVRYSNQHIMGFGADNPEPAPGVYNWASLDSRISLARELGLTPVITLCCAPDWMWGGAPGSTDWSKLGTAPTPDHYDDFAELARQVALRYSDVRYYQVWNEFKGLWNESANNWDYVAYTRLYNAVYDALKSVNPENQVGGPYLVLEGTGSGIGFWGAKPITPRNTEVINYWLTRKHGADFIVLDRPVKDAHDTTKYSDAQLLRLTPEFSRIAQQIRAQTNLPIWWAEDYFGGSDDSNLQAAGLASIMYHELKGGSAASLRWEPQSQPGSDVPQQNLFSDTMKPGGGQPYPTLAVYQAFHKYFGPGTQLYLARSSSPSVEALASADVTLLINKRPDPTRVALNGSMVMMNGYEVRVIPTSG